MFWTETLTMRVSLNNTVVDSDKDFKKPSPLKVSQKIDKTPPKSTEKPKQKTPAKSDDSSEIIEVTVALTIRITWTTTK